mmetsp:Transcript_16836/g.25281  ORF Transcript_16836/g.25281 Transcript_16836/m.25281 type:complete len:843 (+) Transcript_16836:1-2529(+)
MDLAPPGVDHIQTIRSCMVNMNGNNKNPSVLELELDSNNSAGNMKNTRLRDLQDELYSAKRENYDRDQFANNPNDDDDDNDTEISQTTSLRSVFFECNTIFNQAKCVKKLGRTSKEIDDCKTVWIFTNEHDPIRGSEEQRELVQTAARDLVENDVDIRLWSLPRADRVRFDGNLFYKFITTTDDDDANDARGQGMSQNSPGEDYLDLEGLVERFSQAFGKVRKTQSIPMYLPDWNNTNGNTGDTGSGGNGNQNNDSSFSSSPNSAKPYPGIMLDVYQMIRIKKKPLPTTINARTNKRTKRATEILSKETGEIIPKDRIRTFVDFGGERIPITKEEVSQIKRNSNGNPDTACLILLGFKPRSEMSRVHQFPLIDRTLFAYPNEDMVKGSRAAFATLHASMSHKNVLGIGELLQRVTATSRLVAIIPQEEELFEDGEQEKPPGFLLIPMAYEDDIRAIPENGDHDANPDLVSAAEGMIQRLNLDDNIIIGESFENPVLKTFWNYIESVALGTPLVENDADEDDTQWDEDTILSICGNQINTFKQLLPEDEVVVKERKRKTASVKADETGIDWIREFHENSFEELTIEELKAYLRSHGERVGGRKSDLIDRIKDHIQARIDNGEEKQMDLEPAAVQPSSSSFRFIISKGSSSFRLVISKGSILDFHHPKGAIVNAANESCLGGGGVDAAISNAGGKELFKDRKALPLLQPDGGRDAIRCPTGDAKITGPNKYGSIGTPYVIHAVGPAYPFYENVDEPDDLLKMAYRNSLERAREGQLEAVAFSLLSAGVFRGNRRLVDVLRLGIEAICDFDVHPELSEVHLFAFTEMEVNSLLRVADMMQLPRDA